MTLQYLKWASKIDGVCVIGQEVEPKRGSIQARYKEENFYEEGGETLECIAQKGD